MIDKLVKGKVKFVTPVVYIHLEGHPGDLVAVSLEQLIEAKENYDKSLKQVREQTLEEVEKTIKDVIPTDEEILHPEEHGGKTGLRLEITQEVLEKTVKLLQSLKKEK